MTAVLSPTDPLSLRDRMADDNDLGYSHSNTDWRAKYNEVADMLAETRAELDDFHHASKELEAELESELQRTEKAQQDLRVKVEKAETERDQWKSKFVSLQTTHNTTTASLQRELDKLRQEHQLIKVQLRDLEMGNDDLERNERAVSSSLADAEAKYSKALEEKILLEHELLDKANVEEQCQRLKDELRDANVEVLVLRDQITALTQAQEQESAPASRSEVDISSLTYSVPSSSEDLLSTQPPSDLQLSDLTPNSDPESPILTTPRATSSNTNIRGDVVRKGSKPPFNPSPTHISRSTTLPSLSPVLRQPRTPISRPLTTHTSSSIAAAPVPVVSRNKGVQMVSEMRARVKNLEQKIHTRVPRLRMASITGRVASQSQSHIPPVPPLDKPTLENSPFYPSPSISTGPANKRGGDSTGWVLIMEDSPSPPRKQDRERRRITSPSRRFASASSAKNSPNLGTSRIGSFNQSTMGRPASRLSGESLSTTTTASSMSRPTTPTMLPMPTTSLYNQQNGVGSKRSTGPFQQQKRTSLGVSTAMPPPPNTTPNSARRPATMPPPSRTQSTTPSSTSSTRSKTESERAMPRLPSIHSNVTLRVSTRIPPSSSSTSTLSQSRIGKPSTGLSGRRSVGERKYEGSFLNASTSTFKAEGRPRSGSAASPHY